MLSYKYWQRGFGGDPSVVGRIFRMNDRPHQVVGILPPVPQNPADVDVYMPTSACPFRSDPETVASRTARMMSAFARIRNDVTLSKARADLDLVTERMQSEHPAEYPKARGFRISAVPLRDELTQSFKTTLLVLLGTAGFVLLIVCASVANLMLARMVRREREVAIRGALGASRLRLLRQLLTESTLLALAGGLVGLGLARWGVALLAVFVERFTPRAAEITIESDRSGVHVHRLRGDRHRVRIRRGSEHDAGRHGDNERVRRTVSKSIRDLRGAWREPFDEHDQQSNPHRARQAPRSRPRAPAACFGQELATVSPGWRRARCERRPHARAAPCARA